MQLKYLSIPCVLCTVFLVLPQVGRTYDDESLKEKVKPAIEAGVEYLKSIQLNNGVWANRNNQGNLNDPNTIGATALMGIALMECGVSPKDRQIQAAYNIIRQAVSNPAMNYNYSICLCILFLDRVNRDNGKDHKDVGTIRTLATRIAQGQMNNGGWGYELPSSNTDNSNTQFSVVALWVSRKYATKPGGILDQALARTEKKFRNSQRPDGGWSYDPSASQINFNSTGSMTCAGILGIALHAGAKRSQQQANFKGAGSGNSGGDVVNSLNTDEQIVRAREYVLMALQRVISDVPGGETHTPPYFLWSLERVATLYKWRKLNGVDWFDIGATYLLKKQLQRGNWAFGAEDSAVDTAFSLLFLAKSNLLGTLQETAFGGGEIGNAPTIPKDKKPDTKVVDHKEIAKALVEKLLTALPPQQSQILEDLTEAKGSDYTYALAEAIEKLNTNASKESAREALANRMRKLTPSSIAKFIQEDDRELRLAAAVAIRLKNDTSAAAGLIPLLADQDVGVSTAALDSLKAISGQDFGKSVERWSRWLDTKKP